MQLIPLDQIQVPAHLAARATGNDRFLAGLPQGGGFPTIGLKGTRFVVKADGGETVLPSTQIGVVLIDAKTGLDKAFYATKYDPNQTEAKVPDCFSKDGQKPDATVTLKQAESCAGCPMNQFGSGTDASGNPGKGKACSDTKMLAVFANNGIYGFKIPPASLKAFAHYTKETTRRGVDLSAAITVIGFDPNFTYPVLTFGFGGFLAPAQIDKIDQFKRSQEVADIIGGTPTLIAPAVASAPVIEPPVQETTDPFAEVVPPAATAPVKENKPRGRAAAATAPVKENKPRGRAAAAKPVTAAPVQNPIEAEDDDDELKALAVELGVNL